MHLSFVREVEASTVTFLNRTLYFQKLAKSVGVNRLARDGLPHARCSVRLPRAATRMLLALVVLAVPPENSCEGGLLTRLRDIDKATGAQQLHHVTDGIASGKLSKAGHVDKLGECIDVLRAGSSAAESAKLREPATCRPSRRWFQNPLLSLAKDAKKGDAFIVVPESPGGTSGISHKDYMARPR